MGISIQDLINLEDCSKATITKRCQSIRRALSRYKYGRPTPEEKKILLEAMESYKELAFKEDQVMAYNTMLYFYFSSRPLKDKQLAKLLHVDRRTVYKIIDLGVKDLTFILYGVGGLDLLPEEESRDFIKKKFQESLRVRLTEELQQDLKNECCAFFEEHLTRNDACKCRSSLSEHLQASLNNQLKEEFVQDTTGWKDYSDFTIKARQQEVFVALRRYKTGISASEEQEKLMQAMERYKTTVINEKQARVYNILFCFYFAERPLKTRQMSMKFKINKRTVFKYITRGVENLTDIMYGTDGICLKPGDESCEALSDT